MWQLQPQEGTECTQGSGEGAAVSRRGSVSPTGQFPGGQSSSPAPRATDSEHLLRGRRSAWEEWTEGQAPRPTEKPSGPGFRPPPRLFRFRPRRAPPPPARPGFCEGWLGLLTPGGYGRRGFGEGGVAGRGGAGNHRERLRGARGAASSVYEAHGRGAAQPGWRPPPGGATLRPSHSQVPASPSPAPESVLRTVTPGHPPERAAPDAVLLRKAARG